MLRAFDKIAGYFIRSYLKIRILFQSQGELEFQPAGILKYFEELKLKLNTGFGQKTFLR